MIEVVQEVFEQTIRHALKINDVTLTTYSEALRHNVLDPRHWLLPTDKLDALRTNIGEHLTDLSCDIPMSSLSMREKA